MKRYAYWLLPALPVLAAVCSVPAMALDLRNPDSKSFKACVVECRAGRGAQATTAAYLNQSCEEVCDLAADDELRGLLVLPKNAETGEPISATVSLYAKGKTGSHSDKEPLHRLWGQGTFNDLKEGEYVLNAELPGLFQSQNITVVIRPEDKKDYTVEIPMTPAGAASSSASTSSSSPRIIAIAPVGKAVGRPGATTDFQVEAEDPDNNIEAYAVIPEAGLIRFGKSGDGTADSFQTARRIDARVLKDPQVMNFSWQAPENIDYDTLRHLHEIAGPLLAFAGDPAAPQPHALGAWALLLRYGGRVIDSGPPVATDADATAARSPQDEGSALPVRLEAGRLIDGAIDLEIALDNAAVEAANTADLKNTLLRKAREAAQVATVDSLQPPVAAGDPAPADRNRTEDDYLQIMVAVRDKNGQTDIQGIQVEVE